MEREIDFTPDVNSRNFLNIISIIEEHSFIGSVSSSFVHNILATKSAEQLSALNDSLIYLSFKESLTRSFFDFLLTTPHIKLVNSFLTWLDKILTNKAELLEIMNKLTRLIDVENVLSQLNELKTQNKITETTSYDVIFSLIELIENNMNALRYMFFLKNSSQPYTLTKAFILLKTENLLINPFIEFISDSQGSQSYPLIKVSILSNLKKHHLLTEKNFNLFVKHNNLLSLENVIQMLSEKENYLEKYFQHIILKEANIIQIYLHFLKRNNLFETSSLDLLVSLNGSKLENFVEILSLSKNFLKNKSETLQIMSTMKNNYLKKIVSAISLIDFEGYLNESILNIFLSNKIPSKEINKFAQGCIILFQNKLYEEWINKVVNSSKPFTLILCMVSLNRINSLSLENFNKLNKDHLIDSYYRLIKQLKILNVFNEKNFENLVILSDTLTFEIFEELSFKKNVIKQFYLDIFDILLYPDISQQDKSIKIFELVNNKNYSFKRKVSINKVESTHLTSINQAFAKVINKFKESYSKIFINLDYDNYFKDIENKFEENFFDYDSAKFLAAKRALNGLIRDSDYIDEQSQLSLENFFILLWHGIQDETSRTGSLSDAQKQLLEGLYEIQRGGNLNAGDQDNNLPDEPICCTGAFHKLLEKLVGIHNYLDFIYITPELASLKFPIIVKEEANNYLLGIDPYFIFFNYDRLKEEGVTAIWKNIETKVRERILTEFGSLYQLSDGKETHESLEVLLNNHQYLDLDIDLLNSIKVSQGIKVFEFSLFLQQNCVINQASILRKKRNIFNCIKNEKRNKKFYHPLLIKSNALKKSLVFLVGVLDESKKNFLIKKIEALQNLKDNSEVTELENIGNIAQEKLIVTNLKEQIDIVELEDTNSRTVYLNVKQTFYLDKTNYNIYCSDTNSEFFLKFDSDLDLDEIIEFYEQLLFPEESFYLLKRNFYRYSQPHNEIIIGLKPYLQYNLNWINPTFQIETINHLFINEELWPFFKIHSQVITNADQISLINLQGSERPISFSLNKITDIFLFDTQQQINLGIILNSPYIKIDDSQKPNIHLNALNNFRTQLVIKIIEASQNNLTIAPLVLKDLIKKFFFDELFQYIDTQEIDLILTNNINAHYISKSNVQHIIDSTRQVIVVLPALIQTMNGHSENLEKMAALMGSDLTFNHAYQSLIINPNFIRRFPKTINILSKIDYAITSPITKLLLLNSFYELALTLTTNEPFTPEYYLAKNLLTDNSVIFGTILVESLGLNLGFGGLIIDLGITIHQLLTFNNYLRDKQHFHISFWEGIKFQLGFSNNIDHVFRERELLFHTIDFVNSFSKKIGIFYRFFLFKIPSYKQIQSLFISKQDLPIELQTEIKKNIRNFFSTFGYEYNLRIPTSFYRTPPSTVFEFKKKQYLINEVNKFFTVNFSNTFEQFEEDNIFTHEEKVCYKNFSDLCLFYLMSPFSCDIQLYCTRKPFSLRNWKVISSTRKLKKDINVFLQKNANVTIDNELGGLLENENIKDNLESLPHLLILFYPLFSSMHLIDGDFLKNKFLDILIYTSPLEEFFINNGSLIESNFRFENKGYVNQTRYLISTTKSSSLIFDDNPNIFIEAIEFYKDPLPVSIIMVDSKSLKFGNIGPIFYDIHLKKTIKIILNKQFFLKGTFTFHSELAYFENIRGLLTECVRFNFLDEQIFSIKYAVGEFLFDFNNNFPIIIYIGKMSYKIIIEKNKNCFHVHTSFMLSDLNILPYFTYSLPNYFFVTAVDTNELFFYLKGSLGNSQGKLVLDGNYCIQNICVKAQFNFQNNQWACIFFNLTADKFLLSDKEQLKKFLTKKSIKYFAFKVNNNTEQVIYTDDSIIKYKNISYRVDSTLGLLATCGEILPNNNFLESFKNILPKISIDFRQQDLPKKINSTSIYVGARLIVDILLDQELLTDEGSVYMGLLPISIDYINTLQKEALAIDEVKYKIKKFLQQSKKVKNTQQLNIIGTGIGITGSFFTAVSFFIWYKYKYVHSYSSILLLKLAVIYNLIKPTRTLLNNNLYFFTSPHEKINFHNDKKKNINLSNNSIYSFFEHLPTNIIFFSYCFSLFKKIKSRSILSFRNHRFNTPYILYSLGNEITKCLSLSLSSTKFNYKIFNDLLKILINLYFFKVQNNSIIFIENIIQFNLLIDFLKKIDKLKKYLNKKNYKELVAIKRSIKDLNKISFKLSNDVYAELDFPSEQAIFKFLTNFKKLNFDQTSNHFFLYTQRRLEILNDALVDFKKPTEKDFTEFSYFILNIFFEAKRLSIFLNNSDLLKNNNFYSICFQIFNIEIEKNSNFIRSLFFLSNKKNHVNSKAFNGETMRFNSY